jgi:hypothetical protein
MRPEPRSYPTRVKAGVVAVVLAAVLSNGLAIRRVLDGGLSFPRDEVAWSEVRFQRLKKALPTHGVVGYVAEPRRPGGGDDLEYGKQLFLTQYALAPLIVLDSTHAKLVVGNFRSEVGGARSIPNGLVTVEDFGDGLVLLRQRER